jgi:hypothetical protein
MTDSKDLIATLKAEDAVTVGTVVRKRKIKAKLTDTVRFFDHQGKVRSIPKGTVLPLVWYEEL